MSKVTESKLTEKQSKDLRNQCVHRTEVLDKVKRLLLIPELEVMTMSKVAEFYEVDFEAIKKCYQRSKTEIDEDGVVVVSKKSLEGHNVPIKNCIQEHGKCIVELKDGVTLHLPNRGVLAFSKRAILRIGMLLRDSKIAKEVRTQLLNISENVSEEVKISEIDEETVIQQEIGEAYMSGNIQKLMEAAVKVTAYKNRHINALQTAINENQPKVEFADIVSESDKTVSVETFAKMLIKEGVTKINGVKMGRNNLFKYLRNKRILKADNFPYQRYMNSGYFEVVETISSGKVGTQTRITGKGQLWLFEKFFAMNKSSE